MFDVPDIHGDPSTEQRVRAHAASSTFVQRAIYLERARGPRIRVDRPVCDTYLSHVPQSRTPVTYSNIMFEMQRKVKEQIAMRDGSETRVLAVARAHHAWEEQGAIKKGPRLALAWTHRNTIACRANAAAQAIPETVACTQHARESIPQHRWLTDHLHAKLPRRSQCSILR